MRQTINTTTSPSSSAPAAPVAARVTADIRAALERGVRPWISPFLSRSPRLPQRSNGARYQGINILTLWAVAAARGYTNSHWFTFKQAVALRAHVRRGEHGTPICFFQPRRALGAPGKPALTRDAAEDDSAPSRGAILRSFVVFNADQIDGLPDTFNTPAPAPRSDDTAAYAELAAAFARVPATVHPANTAFYQPSTDTVHMPPLHAFLDTPRYYATLAHELSHWTRHPSRLNRSFASARYGDAGYALEELVAELTAAFLGAEFAFPVDHIEDHASYIQAWLRVLTDDPRAFLTAAAYAQAAADYLRQFLHPDTPAATTVGTHTALPVATTAAS